MSGQSSESESDDPKHTNAPEPYGTLLTHYERIAHLESGAGVRYWDQQVTMPEGGTLAGGKQLAVLSATTHESDGFALVRGCCRRSHRHGRVLRGVGGHDDALQGGQ